LTVNGQSVVTSGTYERYFEQDGKRWHHILDPRSGYPLDNELDSVTVISADSLDGDIWTTLLFGLGVEKGCAALRQRQDIDAIFVTKNRDIILSSPQRLRFAPLDSGYRVIDCTA
ncbi:FAD:protein FMN transferase, partial [Klebsiella pneumoniae]